MIESWNVIQTLKILIIFIFEISSYRPSKQLKIKNKSIQFLFFSGVSHIFELTWYHDKTDTWHTCDHFCRDIRGPFHKRSSVLRVIVTYLGYTGLIITRKTYNFLWNSHQGDLRKIRKYKEIPDLYRGDLQNCANFCQN